MNIVAIEDNVLALEELALSIKEACPLDNVHVFSKPSRLLEFARNRVCDMAFLNIEMIELAQKLKEIHDRIEIIWHRGMPGIRREKTVF